MKEKCNQRKGQERVTIMFYCKGLDALLRNASLMKRNNEIGEKFFLNNL